MVFGSTAPRPDWADSLPAQDVLIDTDLKAVEPPSNLTVVRPGLEARVTADPEGPTRRADRHRSGVLAGADEVRLPISSQETVIAGG